MIDPVGTFVAEADGFTHRHPDLDQTQAALGGMLWGLMRAVAECPDHPGRFRVPHDPQWVTLVCPVDGTTWTTLDGQAPSLP